MPAEGEAPGVRAAIAGAAAAIERLAADLALAEEPPRLVAALEAGPPDD